jgi:hypothetical protein
MKVNGDVLMVLNVFLIVIFVMIMLIVMMVLMKITIFVHVNMVILTVIMEAVMKNVLKENGNVLMVLNVFLIDTVVMETRAKIMTCHGVPTVMIYLMKIHIFVHANIVILVIGIAVRNMEIVLMENGNVLMVLNVFLVVGFVMETRAKDMA